MKRIQAACICQTLHFQLRDDADPKLAAEEVKAEVRHCRTKYKIVEEKTLEDGSVIVKIIKQYNSSPVGDYLS